MEPPSLTLRILQGPPHCQGETLEFKPGSAIRIGRVVRGNTLTIKDPGISSKHLCILAESGKWVLRDLDSSNGTVLNGSTVPPETPFPLHDGSTLKIGELTSILVNFLQPTRTVPVTVPEPDPEVEDPDAPVAKPGRGRRGKGLKGKVTVQSIDENATDLDFVDPKKNTRATRNLKNKRGVNEVAGLSVGTSDAPEEKVEAPRITRAARNLKNPQASILQLEVENAEKKKTSVLKSDAPEEKVEEPRVTRVTRNSKNKQSVIGDTPQASSLQVVVENVEKKKGRGGARRKKLPEECTGSGEKETCDGGERENLNGDGRETCDKENLNGYGKETCDGGEKENLNGDGDWPDLEKMSLGEWFDFLEVHLPKQIVDETEEMFASMRQKAERLREYIIMQKNQEVKDNVCIVSDFTIPLFQQC